MRYKIFYIFFILFFPLGLWAQTKTATLSGWVFDDENKPLQGVSVQILSKNKSTVTNAQGFFTINISANKMVAVVISHTGFVPQQKNYLLNEKEVEKTTIILEKKIEKLQEVIVTNDRISRGEAGRVQLDASKALLNPSPNNSIESLLKFFTSPTGELTSQYSVRGGSYDENLIYVNDFEIYKPYLVRSGQQEGLSFINPELAGNVKFYNGGFQAKYGDKLSSALDITYKKPKANGGSAYIGLLEQGVHVEGTAKNNKFSYLLGVRNRSNRNLLSSQQTQGNYIPNSYDIQGLVNYQINSKWNAELFGNFSKTSFTLFPEQAKLSTSVFTPIFSANLGLDIYFQGSEQDAYSTQFLGLALTHQPKKNLKLKWLFNGFANNEKEYVDIVGIYLFGDRSFDRSKTDFGKIVNPLGAGVFQNYARNQLNIFTLSAAHKGNYSVDKHNVEWGLNADKVTINDRLNEWEYNDSAGYSLPYNPQKLELQKVLKGNSDLNILKLSGYVQNNILFKNNTDMVLNIGARFNYNNLNNEFFVSPRVGFSFKPSSWKKNVIFKASVGSYNQPAFYRELRNAVGYINTQVKAQQSWQAVFGVDYNFTMLQAPARLTTELYYKNMTQVNPYDIDNVRVRYFANNQAKAYAVGFETRLYANLVKDAESWLSVGIMQTKEKIDNFKYTNYYNASQQLITMNTEDKVIADSQSVSIGYIRRPTDRLISVGFFYQDYLSTNKNFKVYLSGLYGSNLPYNIPNSVKYRNALVIDPYIRADIGISALLLSSEKQNRRSYSPFKNFESIWASLEIFNIIDRANTISYMLIKDFQNNIFTMPNRLTPRLVNFKIVAKW